jgi:hypothetical protein
MREEMRAQTVREAELARRSSTQEAEARLHEAQQRAETLLREAEQRSETVWREAEQRAQKLVRESEQHAANTVRVAEQGADDMRRRSQQEAEAELREARQEAALLRTELVQVREREEEALRRLRQQQQQQLAAYRNFLERELAELEIIGGSFTFADAPEAAEAPEGGEPAGGEPAAVPPRDSRAAAAAAVLAQSFLVEDAEPYGELEEPLLAEDAEEPFEPEPVYDEDVEPRPPRVPPVTLLGAAEDTGEPAAEASEPEADDTSVLLENASLAGYHLDLGDELRDDPELLLDEPAPEEGGRDDEGDDWLSAVLEGRK